MPFMENESEESICGHALCFSAKYTVHREWGRGEHLSPVSHAEVEG